MESDFTAILVSICILVSDGCHGENHLTIISHIISDIIPRYILVDPRSTSYLPELGLLSVSFVFSDNDKKPK